MHVCITSNYKLVIVLFLLLFKLLICRLTADSLPCEQKGQIYVLAKICQRGSLLILSVGSNFGKTKSVHKMSCVMS